MIAFINAITIVKGVHPFILPNIRKKANVKVQVLFPIAIPPLLYYNILKTLAVILGKGSKLPKPYGFFNDNRIVTTVPAAIIISVTAEMTLKIKSMSFFIFSPPLLCIKYSILLVVCQPFFIKFNFYVLFYTLILADFSILLLVT